VLQTEGQQTTTRGANGYKQEKEGGDSGQGQAAAGRCLFGSGDQVCGPYCEAISATAEVAATRYHSYGRQKQAHW